MPQAPCKEPPPTKPAADIAPPMKVTPRNIVEEQPSKKEEAKESHISLKMARLQKTQELKKQRTPNQEKLRKKPQRPTLSEQLAAIGDKASEITADIQKTHGIEPTTGALATFPAGQFSVGRLNSKLCSPISFFKDKCTYVFHHPFQPTEILMEMHYMDMHQVSFNEQQRLLRFKIDHDLLHYGNDYQANNTQHFVSVSLCSELDTLALKTQILRPYLLRLAGRRRR
eukprot:CAMPEP_0117747780 /NCGR_PEP_ID=MMETSP0947-20121206/8699_1 /TAXON_ID=44440 /ORGANISM="Chattonella subsalsa, Strain CCMP2191" /LENGTH=226 /DNA_ID=CAMNT_0005565267 /DNA_START=280 /DNA_END=960 /DNA_ORIENTATION=-